MKNFLYELLTLLDETSIVAIVVIIILCVVIWSFYPLFSLLR